MRFHIELVEKLCEFHYTLMYRHWPSNCCQPCLSSSKLYTSMWKPRIARKAVRGGGNPLWTHTLSLNDPELSSRRDIFVILEILSADFEAHLPLTIRAIRAARGIAPRSRRPNIAPHKHSSHPPHTMRLDVKVSGHKQCGGSCSLVEEPSQYRCGYVKLAKLLTDWCLTEAALCPLRAGKGNR